ncbi:MAG: hypothetical protein QW634_03380, partial [Candidatus Korarchaeum sp.]
LHELHGNLFSKASGVQHVVLDHLDRHPFIACRELRRLLKSIAVENRSNEYSELIEYDKWLSDLEEEIEEIELEEEHEDT